MGAAFLLASFLLRRPNMFLTDPRKPRFITDPFAALERQMAREKGLELIPDTAIRRLVLWSPYAPPGMWLRPESHLSDDGLHPNPRGNRMLAGYVAGALTRIYGPGVRASPSP